MPRNSSGSYTLPASNPVQTHTTITSNWANGTLADVSAALSASLDRYGNGAMVAALALANGSSALPALTFSAETASGLFRNASQDLEMSINGTVVQKWLSTGLAATLGATLTQSQANTVALVATGNGTAAAATLTGGSSNGSGATAQGGGTSGAGITATGGSSTGQGGNFTGGGTGPGVRGLGGSTSGTGGDFEGGTPNGIGLIGNGTGTAAGVKAIAGGSTQTAVDARGNVDFSNATTGNSTLDRQQTPSNLIRAAVRATFNGGTSDPTVNASFNVSSVKNAGTTSAFYVDLDFDLGTSAVAVFSDISGAPGLFKTRSVEVSQTVVSSKTRISFQTLDTASGSTTSPGIGGGFNLIVTGV